MRNLESALAAVKGRWMTGLTGTDAVPAPWRALIGDGPEAELRLLALVGQAGEVGWVPKATKLDMMPPLPALDHPPMPEPARVRFRQVLAHARKQGTDDLAPVLHLIAARGYSVHPADWMPAASDTTAPPLYEPWIDWLNGAGGGGGGSLTAETWDDFRPAERRTALGTLRRSDPEAMRALLAEKAGSVPAEERLRLITLLAHGLTDADIPYLKGLDKDRSGKVKALAGQYLARLSARQGEPEAVSELADMLEMARAKLLTLSKGLGPKTLKNDAQRKRRIDLFQRVSLHDLAAIFGLSPEEAVAGWRITAQKSVTQAFAAMVAATGPDAVQRPLAERLMAAGTLDAVTTLLPRLDTGARAALTSGALGIEGNGFHLARILSTPDLGRETFSRLTETPDYRALEISLAEILKEEGQQIAALHAGQKPTDTKPRSWQSQAKLADTINTLGLLATSEAAKTLFYRFTDIGLIATDPRLTILALNFALPEAPEGTPR